MLLAAAKVTTVRSSLGEAPVGAATEMLRVLVQLEGGDPGRRGLFLWRPVWTRRRAG